MQTGLSSSDAAVDRGNGGAGSSSGGASTSCNNNSSLTASSLPAWSIYAGIAFLVTLVGLHHQASNAAKLRDKQFLELLESFELKPHLKELTKLGCDHLLSCAHVIQKHAKLVEEEEGNPRESSSAAGENSEAVADKDGHYNNKNENGVDPLLRLVLFKLKSGVILKRWLRKYDLPAYASPLKKNLGLTDLKALAKTFTETPDAIKNVCQDSSDWGAFSTALSAINNNKRGGGVSLEELNEILWRDALADQERPWTLFVSLLMSASIAALVAIMASTVSHPPSFLFDHSTATKLGFFTFISGKYLAPQNCSVEFNWEDFQIVGKSVAFVIRFFQRNRRVYPVSNNDNVLVEIAQGSHKIACTVELGGVDPSDANKACVQFSVRRAGEYSISVMVGMVHIRGSPFVKTFLPGAPDPQKTGFVHHCSTIVCTEFVPHHLFIEPRDKYANLSSVDPSFEPSDDYSVDVVEINSDRPIPTSFRWESHPHLSRIALVLKFDQEGCYRAIVSYRGLNLQNGDFHVIVLNKADGALVQKNVAKKSHNIWYEAKLVTRNGGGSAGDSKSRKVFCYISPKQLTIKEYILKFIPKRLVTFRLCPSTKFQFKSSSNQHGESVLIIDDGCQPAIELLTADRNVIVATFSQFLMKNIGGSETFKDKQDFFYHEVRKLHQKHFHDKLPLKIQRSKLLETSMKATKGFNTGDWCRNFEITFVGEQGLDWGGLRREWFELLCSNLFSAEFQLFSRFKNDQQSLVHPNPKRPPHLKLKHYEFAGRLVGKCLYESALGSTYRQLVKARLSRSFLAQLIGLRVHYKYFEQDDPDLYVSKIRYIVENDVDSMDLYFTEEEYGDKGQLLRVVDLIPNGHAVQITNSNKHRYLDALAQYRLANSIRDEVDYFLKGLNELIPDSLLCIFDENELELLMCGTGQYSIADFKANHAVSGASYEFRKILDWFWTAVSNFTEEEMARLLQFTTGCSQLPPAGFGELNPRFHITAAPTFGNLPTAHTCFNQLCLPDYDSYEQFERALRLAINEGSEGFGMV